MFHAIFSKRSTLPSDIKKLKVIVGYKHLRFGNTIIILDFSLPRDRKTVCKKVTGFKRRNLAVISSYLVLLNRLLKLPRTSCLR